EQGGNRVSLILQLQPDPQRTGGEHRQDLPACTGQVRRLGEHRLTGPERWGDAPERSSAPGVVPVPPIEQRDKWAGIEDDPHGRRRRPRVARCLLLVDRSGGPLTHPTYCRSAWSALDRVRRKCASKASATIRPLGWLDRCASSASALARASSSRTVKVSLMQRW